jgi:hypothetical protein
MGNYEPDFVTSFFKLANIGPIKARLLGSLASANPMGRVTRIAATNNLITWLVTFILHRPVMWHILKAFLHLSDYALFVSEPSTKSPFSSF